MEKEYRTVGVHMPEEWIEKTDELAEKYDCSRAAVFRELIERGEIARKEGMVPFDPRAQERRSAAEMSAEGDHPRWTEAKPYW